MHDEVPPLEPGKMAKGGWNRDLPLTRPRIVPKPYGIPFDPDRAEKVRRDTLAAEAAAALEPPLAPVEPIQPGKMVKGGWNRPDDIPGPMPEILPRPAGLPFDRESAERIRCERLARLAAERGGARSPLAEPVQPSTTTPRQHRVAPGGRPKTRLRRFFSRFYLSAERRHD